MKRRSFLQVLLGGLAGCAAPIAWPTIDLPLKDEHLRRKQLLYECGRRNGKSTWMNAVMMRQQVIQNFMDGRISIDEANRQLDILVKIGNATGGKFLLELHKYSCDYSL